MAPATPEFPAPTVMDTEPARPPVATPDTSSTKPLLPETDEPLSSSMLPELPLTVTLPLRSTTEPEPDDFDADDCRSSAPPVPRRLCAPATIDSAPAFVVAVVVVEPAATTMSVPTPDALLPT
jgi:hypothetical protein